MVAASCNTSGRSRRTATTPRPCSTSCSRRPIKRRSDRSRIRSRIDGMTAVVRSYGGKHPRIGRGVFLAETCALIGDVVVGDESSIWYSTVLRGDVMSIQIGARTSIQDGTVVHVTSEQFGTIVGDDCTIGHSAILHACTVEDSCLIG